MCWLFATLLIKLYNTVQGCWWTLYRLMVLNRSTWLVVRCRGIVILGMVVIKWLLLAIGVIVVIDCVCFCQLVWVIVFCWWLWVCVANRTPRYVYIFFQILYSGKAPICSTSTPWKFLAPTELPSQNRLYLYWNKVCHITVWYIWRKNGKVYHTTVCRISRLFINKDWLYK